MYCDLNYAYNNASDLLQSKNDCVYDEIVKDDKNITEQCRIGDMFTAQGDFAQMQHIFGSDGTPIDNNTVSFGTNTKQFQPQETPNASVNEQQPTKRKYVHDPAKTPIRRPDIVPPYKEPKATEEFEPHNIPQKHETANVAQTKPPPKYHRTAHIEKHNDFRLVDFKNGLIMTLIGVLIIFLLDTIVRIGKKL